MSEEVADGADAELAALRAQNETLEAQLREVRATADRRLLDIEMKAAALQAGMIDLDGLKFLPDGDVRVDEGGHVVGAAEAVARLRRDKPWLFTVVNSSSTSAVPPHHTTRPKLATDMTLDEWRAARAELLRRR